ncbi:BamA/TamA family outer membrane protein [Alloyangia pacifica]|uniref:BamA/TamA family outer membrane protein n=1 Tax=Alloyangia pacifica TaxID=311180 RepID=UPI0031D40B8E
MTISLQEGVLRAPRRPAPPHGFAALRSHRLLTCASALAVVLLTLAAPSQARVYREVEVRGARFIPEDDIRATCSAVPDADYQDYDLRAIEDCLMLTGVFKRVQLRGEGTTLVIDVTEIDARPGRLEGALSYIMQDGFLAEASYEQYDLLPGTFGSVQLSFNRQVRELEGHLYHADQFGETVDLGLDAIWRETDYDDRSYSDGGYRIEPYLAWTPTEDLRLEIGLGWRDYRMYEVESDASLLLQREETDGISAPYTRFALTFGASAELVLGEDRARPAYSVELQQYMWNLGTGDVISDSRAELRARSPLAPELALLTTLRGGNVTGLNDNNTRATDRYFPGADTFRGFAPRGIGPRDGDDMLGGNSYFVASLELQRDFGTILSLPLRGGTFVETGAAWGLDNTLDGRIDDTRHLRSSAGLSLTFDVAEVPVSLFLAQPLRKEPGDETQALGLSFSARF